MKQSKVPNFWAVLIPMLKIEDTFEANSVKITFTESLEVKIQADDAEAAYDAIDSLVCALHESNYYVKVQSVTEEKEGKHVYSDIKTRGILRLPRTEIPRMRIRASDIKKIKNRFKVFYQRIHTGWKIQGSNLNSLKRLA